MAYLQENAELAFYSFLPAKSVLHINHINNSDNDDDEDDDDDDCNGAGAMNPTKNHDTIKEAIIRPFC